MRGAGLTSLEGRRITGPSPFAESMPALGAISGRATNDRLLSGAPCAVGNFHEYLGNSRLGANFETNSGDISENYLRVICQYKLPL
jgi:hypothetical protein